MADDPELPDFDKQYDSLGKQYDELVKTCLSGKAIVDELYGESIALNMLLTKARRGFLDAALVMINGDLDLHTETGIAKAMRAQDELRLYQTMINWIADAVRAARDANEGKGYIAEEMKVRYDDG